MRIHVRARHIKLGQCGHCDNCPVALAIEEAVGMWLWSVNDGHLINIVNGRTVPLPRHVCRRIAAYDAGGTMAPFYFDSNLECEEFPEYANLR